MKILKNTNGEFKEFEGKWFEGFERVETWNFINS